MNQILLFYEIATLPSVARNDYVIYLFRSDYFLISTWPKTTILFFDFYLAQNDYIIF